MDCGDQIRNLAGSDRMMPHVTPDDFRREVWINHFIVHGTIPQCILSNPLITEQNQLRPKGALFPWIFSDPTAQ